MLILDHLGPAHLPAYPGHPFKNALTEGGDNDRMLGAVSSTVDQMFQAGLLSWCPKNRWCKALHETFPQSSPPTVLGKLLRYTDHEVPLSAFVSVYGVFLIPNLTLGNLETVLETATCLTEGFKKGEQKMICPECRQLIHLFGEAPLASPTLIGEAFGALLASQLVRQLCLWMPTTPRQTLV